MDEKLSTKRWVGGIADSLKEGANFQIPSMYYFGRAINYRDDPQALTLLPAAVKESGSVVTDLLKFADIVPVTLTSYYIGDTGNFYSRTSAGSWTNLTTVPNSHGNGLAYFSGDDYVYTASDSNISRYGPTQNSPSFTANFLTAQGGVPKNTASLVLASASSMYGHAADSASLSITSDLTLETYFKANSLPAVGSSMTLLGKWDESAALRSYKLDLFGVSGYFGDGSDGALTISSDTTEAPIDSACSGTVGGYSLTATNASFAQGQVILIHQSQGTGAGYWQRTTIQGYTAGTITLGTALLMTFSTGAQVRVLKQYTNVTVNGGVTWTCKAWNGTVGGILSFLANGTETVTGTISATGKGFRGGQQVGAGDMIHGYQGEGTAGAGSQGNVNANGNGGGSGYRNQAANSAATGGGGANAFNGTIGQTNGGAATPGNGGNSAGTADLTTIVFGGGGGSGCTGGSAGIGYAGGNGGGIIFILATAITVSGSIISGGNNGTNSNDHSESAPGAAGAGGSILIKAQTATLGTNLITSPGGTGGSGNGMTNAGNGSVGRIHLDYLTSYTGTTSPTLDYAQDNTLVTTTTIQARLGISNDGTAYEYLTQNLNTLTTGVWNRLSVVWTASTSTAQFYLNAVNIGQSIGTKTAIHDNASLLYVGANKGASTVGNFFDGKLNDMRIIGNVQSAEQIFANLNNQLLGTYAGLKAYYKFNSAYTDTTANTNTLTAVNSPTFDTADVPFSAPTTRLDIDNSSSTIGQTYTVPTAIAETSVDMLNLAPVNDPQASIAFYVDTKGAGDWTVTVHDQQNRTVASKTIANANIPASGFIEFIFTTPWRVGYKQVYHAHLTVSSGTSKVVTGTTSDFSTAQYVSYFQFLVTDTQFHPIVQFQYEPLGGSLTGAILIGNERYVAVYDGYNYLPNFLAFPPGWHVRCFGQWRQYIAIGVWRGGDIRGFHQGRIYFWTGAQPAYDFMIDVPEGQINALFGVDSDLYMFAGYRGILLDYKGGYFYNTGNTASNKLKRMPLLESSAYTEVYPGALNMWRGMLHFGLYANSSSTTSQRGVYSYGTLNQFYPDSLSYDYPISTGNRSTTVSIGLVYPVGEDLIIGWKDGIACGADVVNFENNPVAEGEVQLMVDDSQSVWHPKNNLAIRADFVPLKTGESITPEVNLSRGGFTELTQYDTVGDSFTTQPINDGRQNEIQLGIKLRQTNGTSPTLLGVTLQHDLLKDEKNL